MPPMPGIRPRATSDRPSFTPWATTRRSQASKSSMPPAIACPLTAAMIGLPMSCPTRVARRNNSLSSDIASSNLSCGSRDPVMRGIVVPKSKPEQKVELSAPVRTTTRTSESALMLSQISARATMSSGLRELRASGRLSVTKPTLPSS